MIPYQRFRDILTTRFAGEIRAGRHTPDGAACLLEAAHVAVGDAWSDAPDRWPDVRPLIDARWSSDAVRTHHGVRVLEVYWDWAEWPAERQRAVLSRVAVLTVNRLVAALPGLPDSCRRACQEARTLREAEEAAHAARSAAREEAKWASVASAREAAESAREEVLSPSRSACAASAAESAAWAARAVWAARVAEEEAAAWAAGNAACAASKAAEAEEAEEVRDHVLATACVLWIEAARLDGDSHAP